MALGPGVPDPPSVVVQSATPLTRHRIGERLGVRVRSVLGGLHHGYLLVLHEPAYLVCFPTRPPILGCADTRVVEP